MTCSNEREDPAGSRLDNRLTISRFRVCVCAPRQRAPVADSPGGIRPEEKGRKFAPNKRVKTSVNNRWLSVLHRWNSVKIFRVNGELNERSCVAVCFVIKYLFQGKIMNGRSGLLWKMTSVGKQEQQRQESK